MARRSKTDTGMVPVLALVGFPIWLLVKADGAVGVPVLAAGLLTIILLVIGLVRRKRAARLQYLRAKFGDESIVQRIVKRHFWQGQTTEQLQEALGRPTAIDNNLLKTRKREVWKYQPNGVNRYKLRITLDDDVVIGWDQKN